MPSADPAHDDLTDFVDGVRRYPRTGIRIVIVGAGLGGLWAALECWRKGHDVLVLEKVKETKSLGDVLIVMPSGMASMRYYPRILREWKDITYEAKPICHLPTGETFPGRGEDWRLPGAGEHACPGLDLGGPSGRYALLELLHNQIAALGIPVLFDREVVSWAEDIGSAQGHVTTAAGEVFTADLVIAADGIGSKSGRAVNGEITKCLHIGQSCIRVGFSPEKLPPDLRANQVHIYGSPEVWLLWFITPTSAGINYVFYDEEEDALEKWGEQVTADQLLERMAKTGVKFDAAVTKFIELIPKDCPLVYWPIATRVTKRVWVSPGGHIVQIGDAAHPVLPWSANGATQALEDGSSLAECLRIGGKAEIAWSLKVHHKLRYERVNLIIRSGWTKKSVAYSLDYEKARTDLVLAGKFQIEIGRWVWGHSPEAYARKQYAKALSHLQHGTPFENSNLPPGHVFEEFSVQKVLALNKGRGWSDPLLETNGDWSRGADVSPDGH